MPAPSSLAAVDSNELLLSDGYIAGLEAENDVLRAELEALRLELEAAGESLALEGDDVEGEDVEELCKPRDAATQASLPWWSHGVGGLALGLTLSRPVCGLLEDEERRTPGPDNGSVPSSVSGLALGQALHSDVVVLD